MSNAPVCHISTNQGVTDQPRPTLLPTVPVAVDLASAIAAINVLKLLIQMLAGQQSVSGPAGVNGLAGIRGQAGVAGSPGAPGAKGQKGKDAKNPRYIEDRSQRVITKHRVTQPDDDQNYVDIERIDRVVWVDSVTGQTLEWSR